MFEQKISLAKIASVVVAVAVVAGSLFAVSATRAHAVTLAELVELFIALDVIPADKAAEARSVLANQAGSTGGGGVSGLKCATFTRNLKQGDTGSDVMDLQRFLNSMNGTQVSISGAGSPGMETMYFGPATAAAVTKFQSLYAADILTPLGLSNGTGFFGAASRAKVAELCAGGPSTPGVPGVPGLPSLPDMDDDDDDMPSMSRSEASLDNFNVLGTPSSEELEEGDEDEPVLGFEFDVEDGDVIVNRVDVVFKGATNSNCNGSSNICERDPWRSFDTVSLWWDGDKIAEVDAGRRTDWSRQGTDEYRVRFSGLNLPFYEGDKPEFVVGVSVRNVIDSTKLNQTWNVWVPEQGVRARDGAGLDQYIGDAGDFESFTIMEVGGDGTLRVRLDSSNPKSSTIKVDTSSNTNNVTVLVGEIEADDAAMTLRQLKFTISTDEGGSATTTYNNVVNNVKLMVGNQSFTAKSSEISPIGGASTTVAVTFDLVERNREIMLNKDQKVKVTLMLDLKRQDNSSTYQNGQQVKASILNANNVTAELSSGLNVNSQNGSAVGEVHTLISKGLFAEIVSTKATTRAIGGGSSATSDVVDFEMVFDVTGFDDTFYIAQAAATALGFVVQDENGNTVGSGLGTTTGSTLSSNATLEGSSFRLNDGDTKRFTFKTTFSSSALGAFRVQLNTINFGTSAGTPTGNTHTPLPVEDFRTAYGNISQ